MIDKGPLAMTDFASVQKHLSEITTAQAISPSRRSRRARHILKSSPV